MDSLCCCLVRDPTMPRGEAGDLIAIARACSPRVAAHGDAAVIFDASGLSRVLGPPETIADEVHAMAASHGLDIRVAVAATMTSAWLLAHARSGLTVVPAGAERAELARLPLGWLGTLADLDAASIAPAGEATRPSDGARARVTAAPDPHVRRGRPRGRGGHHYRLAPGPQSAPSVTPSSDSVPLATPATVTRQQTLEAYRERLAIFARWGLRTLSDLASLVRADVLTRLGPLGARMHQAACGEDLVPLVPLADPARFVEQIALEWPIEGLEPLAFVLGRQCDALSLALERADRGAVAVTTRLRLVTRETHTRTLDLPAPMRDARVLRTLILLDLESHPPPAAIDAVEIDLGVTPGRIVQGSLLTRSLPSPEDLATLIARLSALMGATRVGAPVVVDSHDDRAVAQEAFKGVGSRARASATDSSAKERADPMLVPAVRRLRLPIAARVTLEGGAPIRVAPAARGLAGGRVRTWAGPWRSSGQWWSDAAAWDRDGWDVEVADGIYRLCRDRRTGGWVIEGILD